jgi:hypothetical protein
MKKIILTMAVVLTASFANAQDMKFGVRGGLDMVSAKSEYAGIVGSTPAGAPIIGTVSATYSTTGFYFGGFVEFGLSDKFMLQPGLNYHTASDSGVKFDFLSIPVTFKYQVADKINILAGPTMFYSMESDDPDKTRFNLDLGGSYDISDKFFIDPRYSIGLTGDSKVNHFLIGVGYKF